MNLLRPVLSLLSSIPSHSPLHSVGADHGTELPLFDLSYRPGKLLENKYKVRGQRVLQETLTDRSDPNLEEQSLSIFNFFGKSYPSVFLCTASSLQKAININTHNNTPT